MDLPTNLTQADHQRLQRIEDRLDKLEAIQPVDTSAPTLSAEDEAKLAELSKYLSLDEQAMVRAKMLAAKSPAVKTLTDEQQAQLDLLAQFLGPQEVDAARQKMLAG